jgi:molybdopterin biosynthesis enzyme
MGAATGLSFADALAVVLRGAGERRPRSEVVPIEQAFGRALSQDVTSRIALPP